MLFQPDARVLIAGDALWENGFGVVFPDAFDEVAATLDRIEALQPAVVIPGHGAVFAYRQEVMDRARQRLASFVSNPQRHAQHAAKVLIKFKLLEVQKQPTEVFVDWAASTPYLTLLHQRFFADRGRHDWLHGLLHELQAAGAARLDAGWTLNK